MSFREWIESRWMRDGETITAALQRLSAESGLTYKSLFYAHKGARVTPDTAKRIEDLSAGNVRAESLVLLPTRREVRTGT